MWYKYTGTRNYIKKKQLKIFLGIDVNKSASLFFFFYMFERSGNMEKLYTRYKLITYICSSTFKTCL